MSLVILCDENTEEIQTDTIQRQRVIIYVLTVITERILLLYNIRVATFYVKKRANEVFSLPRIDLNTNGVFLGYPQICLKVNPTLGTEFKTELGLLYRRNAAEIFDVFCKMRKSRGWKII